MEDAIPEISATELKRRLDDGEPINIVDVREEHEWEIGNLGPYGARLIPLGEIEERMDEIDDGAETVLLCRSGARSGRALELLREHGHEHLLNLKGGMLAWSDEIDPTIPKY